MLPTMVRLILFVVMLLANNKLAHGLTTSNAKIRCIEREKQTLLKFRQTLVDYGDVLSSWGIEHYKKECCEWRGVTCNNQTGHVTVLDLHTSEVPLTGEISPSLFELQHLKYLDLSGNDFRGNFSPILKNLSCLRYLNLSGNDFYFLSGGNLKWLSYFPLLRYLDLQEVDLSQAINWVELINNLPLLENLNLARCQLPNPLPPTHHFNFSMSSLAIVDLSSNSLSSSVYHWLVNFSSTLVDVNLQANRLNGSIPGGVFDKMVSLVHLNLAYNDLEGGIPKSFANLICLQLLEMPGNKLADGLPEFLDKLSGSEKSLRILDLEWNQITGTLPDFTRFSSLEELYLGENQLTGPFPKSFQYVLPNLVTLTLFQNKISGMLPDLTAFPSLTLLDLRNNKLNGSVDKSIWQLSKLETLDASLNSLQGIISETHFSNLSNLKHLDFSFNSLQGIISETHFSNLSNLKHLDFSFNQLVFNITPNWIPPFQLHAIGLASCKLGPYFPKWLQKQSNFSVLDISGAGISDVVPFWFWDLPPNLRFLNLSCNQMSGPLPDFPLGFFHYLDMDLSSNLFRGQLTRVPSNVTSLNLSKNLFSGSISFVCAITGFRLDYLDLSSNQLSGALPDCWEPFQELTVINLANNSLSGKLPSSWGSLYQLQALQLRGNNLSGELPESMKKCMELLIIDLEGNRFKGKIQPWIGTHFPNLIILSLRFNEFYGAIPRTICHLNNIQVLDLSQNHFSGRLPRCFNNFSALARIDDIATKTIDFYSSDTSRVYRGNAWVQWKGQEREYGNTLALLKFIDLSSNNFSGKIPQEIAHLGGLLSLNLSRNNFTGKIIENIDQMKMLESLDLSANRLFGEIPTTFAHLSFLSVLDLSHNNLSGKIPLGTQLQSFNPSVYFGNPLLCGVPLPKKCPGEEKGPGEPQVISPGNEKRIQEEEDEGNKIITKEFYISMGVGFAFGFWAIFGTMLFSRTSRYACFMFLARVAYWFYDTTALTFARLQRRLRG